MITRRAAIFGGIGLGLIGVAAGAGALAAHGDIPGKGVIDERLGFCDATVPTVPAGTVAGPRVTGQFHSARRGRSVDFQIAYPPGHGPGDHLPVAVALHGFAAGPAAEIDGGRYPLYLAAATTAGVPPFAIAAPSGGNGYWHPQPGDDPLGMVLDEFLPMLSSRGLRVDRPAVMGTSMGGFGSILCGLTAPGRFAAVVASAPAFWRTYAEAKRVNAGSFSSEPEWRSYGDLMARTAQLDRLPLHIYIGKSDPFEPAVTALRDRLADRSVVKMSTGCHDPRLWRHYAPEQLRLIGAALVS